MKIFDGYNEKGKLVYFEVSNTFMSKKTATRIISKIPNILILNQDLSNDVFCTFEIDNRVFEIMEPWGDNSRYHIGEQERVRNSNELLIIKKQFHAHKTIFSSIFCK